MDTVRTRKIRKRQERDRTGINRDFHGTKTGAGAGGGSELWV